LGLSFDTLNQFATDTANMTYADKHKKEIIRDNILKHFAVCCVMYNTDKNFKREMDAYLRYLTL
jgi:hypothetical protein